jgi:hypothetical protein
LIDV